MEKKKMNLWKKILIVIFILLIIFIAFVIRKMIIFNYLQNKLANYINSENYCESIYQYEGDSLLIQHIYKKEGKSLSTLKVLTEDDTNHKMTNYSDGEVQHTFIDIKDSKIAILDENTILGGIHITNELYTENLWQLITMSIFSKITTEKCNGKDCYKIDLVYNPSILFDPKAKMIIYYEKQTGLRVRAFEGTSTVEGRTTNMMSDYYYEFNNVTDDDLKEPNINEYNIQKSN